MNGRWIVADAEWEWRDGLKVGDVVAFAGVEVARPVTGPTASTCKSGS